MHYSYRLYILIISIFFVQACSHEKHEHVNETQIAPVEEVLTAEQQAKLTPEEIIRILKEGNMRFMSNNLTARDHSAQVRNSTYGQYPKAIVLSCIDSRIPVEDVFDRGIGDLFVARVAGNFANTDILGSMEYGCKVAGSKLILVLGHEHCGAVKAAVDKVELGNITSMLSNIQPAVAKMGNFEGDHSSKNESYVHNVCIDNVGNTIEYVLANSPILKEMKDSGQIDIRGAVYDMDTGKVEFLDEQ